MNDDQYVNDSNGYTIDDNNVLTVDQNNDYVFLEIDYLETVNYTEHFESDHFGNPIVNTSAQNIFTSIPTQVGNISNIERGAQIRYGNASKVRLEIRYGSDNSIFTLDQIEGKDGGKVYIDYIKTPQHIRLTQEEIDYTEDKSQVLEFPDYVCQEILNELVILIMENISDPKLQTFPVVNQSIANPAQAQTPQAQGQSA